VIGVICAAGQGAAVREFFQLFKTPWEMFDPEASYDAVIVSGVEPVPDTLEARLVICFSDELRPDDALHGIVPGDRRTSAVATSEGSELPLFCGATELRGQGRVCGWFADNQRPIVLECQERDANRLIRCGYNLFSEVERLLTLGQPVEHARTPTLDLHIDLLRRWLVDAGVGVIELYPTPPNCGLLASLTHDIDFFGIRRHKHDKTLIGFLYRALVGSAVDLIRGRGSMRRLLRNWRAVLSLPLVHAGLVEDFWLPFERYLIADAPWRSTFFVIPFRGRPGVAPGGGVATSRAVPYQASEIAAELRTLAAGGHEVAVHGIDAWRDSELGRQELETVNEASWKRSLGVRMHWLYLDQSSFRRLDRAGFDYDSSFGYNDRPGFRAGTSQVFAPLGASRLLELPLHIQDTTLLFPGRMNLTEEDAVTVCEQLVDTVARNGGVATVSWHERSLSPERLWDGVYGELLAFLRSREASVRPACEVISWFRLRRNVELEGMRLTPEMVSELAIPEGEVDADALRVRIHHPSDEATGAPASYSDVAVAAEDLNAAGLALRSLTHRAA
jgi:hypothetical protein